MKIYSNNISPTFMRRLKPSETAEYSELLKNARNKLTGGESKNYLIIPVSSLPQNDLNNTGVGNLSSEESAHFFDFAKKYWGINEIQLLPCGQYHFNGENVPVYSGTTMDFGNHIIDLKEFLPKEEYENIVKTNKILDKVNYSNVIRIESPVENALRKLHKNIPSEMQAEFREYKKNISKNLESKALYRALRKHYNHYDYRKWSDIDKNLFNEKLVSIEDRKKRINEIYSTLGDEADYYKFKQFLAEKSFKKAKESINTKGIKLNGDMPCGYSYDEVWAHPNAFIENGTIGWSLPALNYESEEAEKLLRDKTNWYARHFDGFRVDASWSYVSPKVTNKSTGEVKRYDFGEKFLNIIDDEVRKVKGNSFNLKNITHEFAASPEDFSLYIGNELNPAVKNRVKIFTSEIIHEGWGSANAFLNRGWGQENFLIGASNHDSAAINPTESQANELGKILKIQPDKLMKNDEFLKAKFAEPMNAKNNFIFFMPALGFNGSYKGHINGNDNYTAKIPKNYEDFYINSLNKGYGFNPMDGLEKCFKAKGLDKTEPKLYKKIVKYKKILYKNEKTNIYKTAIITGITTLLCIAAIYTYFKYRLKDN